MAGLVGADPDGLDVLARTMTETARELRLIESRLGGRLRQVEWLGTDGDGLRADWTRHATAITTAATDLEAASGVVTRQAAEQRQASGADGAPVGGLVTSAAFSSGAASFALASAAAPPPDRPPQRSDFPPGPRGDSAFLVARHHYAVEHPPPPDYPVRTDFPPGPDGDAAYIAASDADRARRYLAGDNIVGPVSADDALPFEALGLGAGAQEFAYGHDGQATRAEVQALNGGGEVAFPIANAATATAGYLVTIEFGPEAGLAYADSLWKDYGYDVEAPPLPERPVEPPPEPRVLPAPMPGEPTIATPPPATPAPQPPVTPVPAPPGAVPQPPPLPR